MGEKIGFSKMLLSLFPITEGLHTTGTQPLGTVYSKPVWLWPGPNFRPSGRSPKRMQASAGRSHIPLQPT